MSWEDRRRAIRVCIFGSFDPPRLKVIDELVARLRDHGFVMAHRVEIRQTDPRRILDYCARHASTVPVAIFVLFHGDDEPNQSALIELKSRLDSFALETGIVPGSSNTAVFAEQGVPIRALLAGLLAYADVSTPDSWATPEELEALVRGFLLSAAE